MIVSASSRSFGRFVGALLVVAFLFGLAVILRPQVGYRCPCGFTTWLGLTFCNPCIGAVSQPGTTLAQCQPRRIVVGR